MPYWYNVDTGQVEEDSATSSKDHLMGPYPTQEAAQAALSSAAQRTEDWDEEEARRLEEKAREEGREPGESRFPF